MSGHDHDHDHDHARTVKPMVDEITDFEVLEIALRELCRDKKGFVTVESNIWQASWHEAGVAHSLHVECAVAGDGRCADDKFLVSMVESLAHVGGRGGAP